MQSPLNTPTGGLSPHGRHEKAPQASICGLWGPVGAFCVARGLACPYAPKRAKKGHSVPLLFFCRVGGASDDIYLVVIMRIFPAHFVGKLLAKTH